MSTTLKYTSADLALMPDDGKRYEIIEGELYVSRQPITEHQYTCFVEVYRREEAELHLAATLSAQDKLESPLLPGFSYPVSKLFLSSLPV